jgi:hypothetical protein
LFVAVAFDREYVSQFGPKRGEVLLTPMRFVGVSAREISCELPAAERIGVAVVWRFFSGSETGGDDPKTEPPWKEERIEVPSDQNSASKFIEQSAFGFGQNFRWFLMEP